MDKVNPIVFVCKRIDGDSERMIVLDSWESVCYAISCMNGFPDSVHIYRCDVQSSKSKD